MAFKDRISGMFRFGAKGAKDKTEPKAVTEADSEEAHLPAPATAEEREELIQELGEGFTRVGNVLERLDQNLGAGVRLQEQLPVLITEQHDLIRQALDHATITRTALESLAEHLNQRDATQQAVVDRLEQLGTTMRDQQNHHDRQLQLVMSFHRSSRFMTAMLVLGAFLLIILLLGSLMAVIANPSLIGSEPAAAAPAPTAQPAPAPAPTTQPAPAPAPAAEPTSHIDQSAPAAEPIAQIDSGSGSGSHSDEATTDESAQIVTLIEEAKNSDNPTIANRASVIDQRY